MYRVYGHCDVFQNGVGAELVANSGVLDEHLARLGWEMVLRHIPMPAYAKKQISERGYYYDHVRSAAFPHWYGKQQAS